MSRSSASAATREPAPTRRWSTIARRKPARLPTTAALVSSGKSRRAWRASKVRPPTVHMAVSSSDPAAYTLTQTRGMMASMPESTSSHSTASTPASTDEEHREEAAATEAGQGRAVAQGHHQAHDPETDEQAGQDLTAEARQDERVDADLAESPAGVHDGEGARDEHDRSTLPRADGEHIGSAGSWT